jgi:large subunit ribosomal protein L14
MIGILTNLKVADNSGAKIIECFQIQGGSKHKFGRIGDIVKAVVKEAEPRRPVKKHELVRAVIVRQKKEWARPDGSYIRFDDNAAVILEGQSRDPKGSRIFGPIPRELREKGFEKIIALAEELV